MISTFSHLDITSQAQAATGLPSAAAVSETISETISETVSETVAEVVEVQVLPAAAAAVSRSAQVGWMLSTATHVAGAVAVAVLAIYGPELPTIGSRRASQPVALAVRTHQPTHSHTAAIQFTAAPQPTQILPRIEPVEQREPTETIDDTQRRFVHHEAPAASSPPMMSREEAESAQHEMQPLTSREQHATRSQKHRAQPPAVAAPALIVTQHATPLENSKPQRPDEARHLSGRVLLRLHIDATGRVRRAEVQQSSGHAILDRAAASHAQRHWRFRPARSGSRPIAQTIRVPVVFL